MSGAAVVRPGRSEEFDRLRVIEREAGRAYAAVALSSVADDEPPPVEVLAGHAQAGTLWVAAGDDGEPIGYATASVVDGEGHLDQVSVHPDHQRGGVGRRLIERVCAWAAAENLGALTLTTYRDVAWNGPAYQRLGFAVARDDELGPELAAIRRLERDRGLDVQPRVAMRRLLTPGPTRRP